MGFSNVKRIAYAAALDGIFPPYPHNPRPRTHNDCNRVSNRLRTALMAQNGAMRAQHDVVAYEQLHNICVKPGLDLPCRAAGRWPCLTKSMV